MRTPQQELLWELSRAEADSEEAILSDELLNSYRSRGLAASEVRRVEAILSRSAASRAKLAELVGVEIEKPPERVRKRIFGEGGERRAARNGWFRYVAAAVLAAVLVIPLAYQAFRNEGAATEALPAGLDFEIRVEALSRVRSEAGLPEAFPESPVRVVLEPWRDATSGLVFALYRKSDESLRRLEPGGDLDVEVSRGSVTFTTRAAALVDPAPGEHEFFIVVAREGTLPREVALGPERTTTEALKEASGGLVYRRSLTVLDSPTTP